MGLKVEKGYQNKLNSCTCVIKIISKFGIYEIHCLHWENAFCLYIYNRILLLLLFYTSLILLRQLLMTVSLFNWNIDSSSWQNSLTENQIPIEFAWHVRKCWLCSIMLPLLSSQQPFDPLNIVHISTKKVTKIQIVFLISVIWPVWPYYQSCLLQENI